MEIHVHVVGTYISARNCWPLMVQNPFWRYLCSISSLEFLLCMLIEILLLLLEDASTDRQDDTEPRIMEWNTDP